MSPRNSALLVNEVIPRLRNGVRNIPMVGHEDADELIQDCCLQAARMLESAEKAGHPISAGNASYYALKAARSGRRSFYTGRSDVLHPGCQLDGRAQHDWLDTEIVFESGEVGNLHDVISSQGYQGHESDPAEEASRNMDWESFLNVHSPRHRIVIQALLEGCTMREAGKRCGLKDSAALMLKRRIGADLLEFFGEDVITRLLHGVSPNWESDLRSAREQSISSRERNTFQPHTQPVG